MVTDHWRDTGFFRGRGLTRGHALRFQFVICILSRNIINSGVLRDGKTACHWGIPKYGAH